MNKSQLLQAKSRTQAQIASISEERNALQGQLSQLIAARADLSSKKTSVKYELISHSNIKANYTLAGVAYLKQTDLEENTLKQAESAFKSKKSIVIEQLDSRISGLQGAIANLGVTLGGLTNSLEMINSQLS